MCRATSVVHQNIDAAPDFAGIINDPANALFGIGDIQGQHMQTMFVLFWNCHSTGSVISYGGYDVVSSVQDRCDQTLS